MKIISLKTAHSPALNAKDKDEMTTPTKAKLKLKLKLGLLASCLLLGVCLLNCLPPAYAAGPDSNPLTHWDTRYNYFLRFPAAAQHGIRSQHNPHGGRDVVTNQRSTGPGRVIHGPGPVFSWPVTIPTAMSDVPTHRDTAIQENLFQTFGYPVSDTQFQIIERYNHNRFLEQLYDPEKVMWMSTSMAGVMANSAGNSTANMGINQCINAIDYVRQPLGNFTAEAGNVWQRIRYELFIPMAVLLLLPGAVLAQVRAIVAQGSGVLGDVSPFEGLIRSVIAIFLIPGSFLVINYGIDVSNSLTFTIADEYRRMFGSDMYEDAKCAIIRALPINDPNSNRNAIEPPEQAPIVNHDVWSPYESWSLATRLYDPCIPHDESRLPDEDVNASMMINRLLFNGTLASLGLTWNIYCAFQMVFLYYLWCMGPIASALWVWPIPRLRQAFGNWVEGVIILCFWALFWNTSIFLLAAFKGIGDTGTVYTCALVFLCVQSVKSAFDFVNLVSSAASGAETMAKEAMGQLSSAMSKAGGRDRGGSGSPGGAAPGGSRSGGPRGGAAPSAPVSSSAAPAPALSGSGPVSRGGLSQNLSLSPAPMTAPGGGAAGGGGSRGGGGGTGGGPGGPGGGASPGALGTEGGGGTGPGGAQPDTGPPPGTGGADGPAGGKGEGDAAGAAAAAIGGLALSGKGGDGGGGAPPMSSASYSLSNSKSVTNLGDDIQGGDANAQRNMGDNSLFNNNLAERAAGQMGLPPLAGATGELANTAANQAFDKVFGPDGPSGMDNKALTAAGMLSMAGPEAMMGPDGPMSSAADRNPMAKDLALDQMFASGSQRDVMANGIDADVAGHPQAELARSCTQDLMKAASVIDDTLNRALAGDQSAARSIENALGVSPMTLEMARGGDPGAAALTMEAAAHHIPRESLTAAADSGNLAAAEALNIPVSPDRQGLIEAAALRNDPVAAQQLLSQNGEHTVASMSSAQMVRNEMAQAGITEQQFRQAQSGDAGMQQAISQQMGGTSFDKIQSAYHGDTGDAATMMVARGNQEIQNLQAQGLSGEAIQQRINGDVSMMAAQAVHNSAPQGTLERAMAGDQTAQRELQQSIGSSPAMLQAAHSGSPDARLAIEGSTGQSAVVMSAASHNTQAVLSQMTGDARQVEQALNGSPQQREAFVQQMSSELGVSPRVLNEAVNGGSLESGTVMARAGQIASAGSTGGGNLQLSESQHRLVEGLQSGNGLMTAAQSSYMAATSGGQDTQTLAYAAQGSSSHAVAAASAMQASPQLQSMYQGGSAEAGSVLNATSGVTYSAREALSSFSSANPTASLHDASVTAQTTLRAAGIDPQQVVSGVRSGDNTELTRAASTLGVTPDVVQGALMRGDSGDAMTLVGAAGRHMLAQGPEAVQQYAQSPSAHLAMHVAQNVQPNVLSAAMSGNEVAQAQIARSVASDPQVLGSAAGNEYSLRAVGATLGDGAYSAVAASGTAQEMVRMHPDSSLVQTALYGQGASQQAAMTTLARDMNVAPQVLAGALTGSSQDSAALVSSSSAGLKYMQETGQTGSQYFNGLSRAVSEQTPLASAIQAAGAGQSIQAVTLAGQNVAGAQEAVRATMEANPHLARMVQEGNPAASAILTASSTPTFGNAIRDVGIVAAAGSAIAQNLRVDAGPGHYHHHIDRGAVGGYEQFRESTGREQYRVEPQAPINTVNNSAANRNAIEGPTARGGQDVWSPYEQHQTGAVQQRQAGPVNDPNANRNAIDPPAGRGGTGQDVWSPYEQHQTGGAQHRGQTGPVNDPNANRNAIDPPAGRGGTSHDVWSGYERHDLGSQPRAGGDFTRDATPPGGGMAGADGMSRPQPPDSLAHGGGVDPTSTYIADAGRRSDPPTGSWFDQTRPDAPAGPKISDATQGAAPAIVPGGTPQNRSLTPQTWQGTSGQRERKAHDEKVIKQRVAELRDAARRAREANNQAELDAIRRNLEQYGSSLDDE